MAIVKANYWATYEDYEGGDLFPCQVDTNTMTVVSFDTPTECRWFDGTLAMCVEEGIEFEDGRDFNAVKFDEWNDLGVEAEEWYPRAETVLFDADMLSDAAEPLRKEALERVMEGYTFTTCEPVGVPALVDNADCATDDVLDAHQHLVRARSVMAKSIERLEGYRKQWSDEQYDYRPYIKADTEALAKMDELIGELDALVMHLKEGGCA